MLHTSRRNPFLGPLHTEIAKVRRKRNIIDRNLLKGFQYDLVYLDAPLSNRVVVFLFASHFAGMASCAVFVINE
jgi:hypothetical protein